jgi:2-dehydro-3-deoxyphosphogluconate aldolase/(4S)-4-hydroxy-2-oxoglutarate aldolase
MARKSDVMERVAESGAVAVLRGVPRERVVPAAEALVEGGVTALEVTADNPDAVAMVADLTDAFADHEAVVVGAGTVLDASTAVEAIRAGAEFVVAPHFDPAVVDTCNRHGTVVAPGILTPTEAVDAAERGADFLKLFPASSAGPSHLSGIRGALGQLEVMPTGGVDADNAGAFVEAGAFAVGAGGALVDRDAIERGDYEALTANAEELVAVVEAGRE